MNLKTVGEKPTRIASYPTRKKSEQTAKGAAQKGKKETARRAGKEKGKFLHGSPCAHCAILLSRFISLAAREDVVA